MYIKWENPDSLVVQKTEAEAKVTALVVDQICKIRREIHKKELLTQDEILRFLDAEVNRVLGMPPSEARPQNRDGFVVASKAVPRKGLGERTMFLVDRGRIHHSWWSDDLEDALVFDHREVADRKCASLRHNSPEVLTYSEALLRNQLNDRAYTEEVGL